MENQRTIKIPELVYTVRKYRNSLVLLVAAAFFCGVGLMFLSRYRADAKKWSKITASFAVTAENSQGGYSANHTETIPGHLSGGKPGGCREVCMHQ